MSRISCNKQNIEIEDDNSYRKIKYHESLIKCNVCVLPGLKLITACSGETEVDGNVPPFYWISPNYPLSYDGGEHCHIRVNADSSKTYKVSFLDLEIEARGIGNPGCYDKVMIRNEQMPVYTYTYCGRFASVKTGENLVMDMQHLKMTLYTDGATHMRGMLIKVEGTWFILNLLECGRLFSLTPSTSHSSSALSIPLHRLYTVLLAFSVIFAINVTMQYGVYKSLFRSLSL